MLNRFECAFRNASRLMLLDASNLADIQEDDSPKEVAMMLCQLHAEAGITTTAEALFARAASRGGSSWVEVPPQPRVRRDNDGDSDAADDSEVGAQSSTCLASAPPFSPSL